MYISKMSDPVICKRLGSQATHKVAKQNKTDSKQALFVKLGTDDIRRNVKSRSLPWSNYLYSYIFEIRQLSLIYNHFIVYAIYLYIVSKIFKSRYQ